MNRISILGSTLHHNNYKALIELLCKKSDCVAFNTLSLETLIDDDDKEYSKNVRYTKDLCKPFIIKNFHPSSFGLTTGGERNITIVSLSNKIVKDFLIKQEDIYYWCYPTNVEDLCFFKKNKCIFASVTHEDMFYLYTDEQTDIDFLDKHNIKYYSDKIDCSQIPLLR